MPEHRCAKVEPPCPHFPVLFDIASSQILAVTSQRQRHEPPWMIVGGTIFVACKKTVQAQRTAKPQNPAFEIGSTIVVDDVVREPNGKAAKAGHIKIRMLIDQIVFVAITQSNRRLARKASMSASISCRSVMNGNPS